MEQNPMDAIPGVPPPPAEVKVRTMRSDIESMEKSGGGLPQFRNVAVAGLTMERAEPTAVASPSVAAQMARAQDATSGRPAPAEDGQSASSSHNMVGIILVVVVAVIALAVVGYFAYTYLGK